MKSNIMPIKDEIKQIVDSLPDDSLKELRDYLKQLDKIHADKKRMSINLSAILRKTGNSLIDLPNDFS